MLLLVSPGEGRGEERKCDCLYLVAWVYASSHLSS